ncbi:MAG TPA: ROK family protein [Planctomycetota bacterium]|nr:ROK family protein [Planctomycetota bacterium]
MADLYLGIDLGGTFVKLGVCDARGEVAATLSIPTRPDRGAEDTVQRIGEAADTLQRKTERVKATCAGVPGPLDLERRILVRANNLPGWDNVRFPQMLGNRLGMPTYMENDANCAAWGEYVAGAGKDFRSLVVYTLGTGIGGGIVINGDLWIGASGAAGELGHMSIDPNGPMCGCGQPGCLEQYASATAVAKKWGKGTAKDCFDAARKGDAKAMDVINWASNGLATGVANMIHVLHPDIIVLAGGMAQAGDILLDKVREGVKRRVFGVFIEKIRIETSKVRGDDAGWLGAALWAARKLETRDIREPTATRV